ncbi:Extracellular calcium-sensing receptor, partial [Trichoplax sp. H2]
MDAMTNKSASEKPPNEFSTTTSAITQAVSNKLAGIIGTQTARGSIDMQGICKVFNLVQITYGAKEGLLGDKTRFPTILRTIPPEDHYPAILESILSYFNWKFIAMLSYVGDLGSRAYEQARKYFQRKKICVLLAEKVSRLQNSIAAAVSKIKTSPAKVVIVMVTNQYLTSIIQEFEKQNVTGKIIITTGTLESQFFKTSRDIIGGMISISLKHRPSSKFVEYLRKFTLCLSLRPFLSQELENRGFTNFTEQDLEESYGQLLNKIGETKKDIYRNSFSISYVVDAVNALAHSIHKTLNCSNSASAPIFKFDANGNPSHIIYYIHNIKSTLQNTYDVVLVGTWRNNHFPPLHINDTLVSFGPYSNLSQISNPCSSTCQPGSYYQYLTNLTCCWKCISCPLGTVNNQSQSSSCFSCPLGSLANRQRTQCHLIEPYELTFYSIQNVIMLIYLSLGAVCTVFTWIVIILYRHTAVVKASDFMLSQMFLLGILMCMSTAVSFAAPVSMLNCSVGFIWFCTSVVFIVSIIFVKTNRVSRVFESGFVKSFKTRVHLSYQGPAILVVFLTVIQIAICFIANYFDPIQVNRLVISEDIVYLQCRSNTRIGYAIAVGYFSVLCICCVYWAFKTRKLPENFCEAKYINFTSLIILMSLLTMVPSYFGTAGPIQAAISSF